jgi:beta-galactosidase
VDRWTHLAATFDNRVMRLYVDGKEVAHRDRPGLIKPSSADLYLGTFAGTPARFHGLLDDVRIFDRPLTPAEIAAQAAR